MNNKRLIIPIIILLIIGSLFIYFYNLSNHASTYFTGKVVDIDIDIIKKQETINSKLDDISNDPKYTLDNPYIELNPYKISPLSAIIIFYTDKQEEVSIYINDTYFTTIEKSKKHIIPIMGLLENYDNKITLKTKDKEVTHKIKTFKSDIKAPLTVTKSKVDKLNDDLYFMTSSLYPYFSAYDKYGNLRFYFTLDNRMDVEWLDNGHFLIGVTEGNVREQFIGFVEVDYLGKVYNYYTLENGYSFDMQLLKNGNLMVAGGKDAIYIDHQLIYEMDLVSGEKISELDIYDVIKRIDPDFNDKFLGAEAIRNSFFYNETTHELLVSFREINTIFSFNYEKKTLNYVFTNNPLFKGDKWSNYKVKLNSGRYPLGQHTVFLTKAGNVGFFNNGYDRYKALTSDTNVKNYKNAYSSLEIYSIKNKEADLIYSYNRNKKVFSIKYGLFTILPNGNKLADYGYVLEDYYLKNKNNTIKAAESTTSGNYAEIIELDKEDKILFKAKTKNSRFRVFKHDIYSGNITNINLKYFRRINTVKNSKLNIKNVKDYNLDSALTYVFDYKLTRNTFETNYQIKDTDDVKLLFLNKVGLVYELDFDKNKVFNLNVPSGNYVFFIKINGELYKTNLIYNV